MKNVFNNDKYAYVNYNMNKNKRCIISTNPIKGIAETVLKKINLVMYTTQ